MGERVRLLRISEEVELNLGSLTLLDEGGFIPGAVAVVGGRDTDGTVEVTVEGGDETPPGLARPLRPPVRRRAVTLRLVADAVFTVDADGTVLSPGRGRGHRRADLVGGRPGAAARPAAGAEVRELGGVLMPGLVNCHGHSPMTLRAQRGGRAAARPLAERVGLATRGHALSDEDVYWGMTLGAAELLTNGTTTTCEQYRHPAPVIDAVLAAGIRGVFTPGIFEVPGRPPGRVSAGRRCWPRRAGCSTRWTGATAGYTSASARTPPTPCRPTACARSPPKRSAATRCSRSIFRETEAECAEVLGRYGMSAPALLADVGALDGRALAAHAVWLDDDDLALLAGHDVARGALSRVQRQARLRRRPACRRLLERGVRVGLGTDGPASNDDLHLWDEMRLAALFARARAGDPGAVTTATALRLATRGGGEALGLPVGALEPGRPADIIRLRTDDPRFTPR